MKTTIKRALSLCLVALMLLPLAFISVGAEGTPYDPTSEEIKSLGATFDSTTTATMEKILPSLPYTYEAEIQLNTSSRGGVILGNYSGFGKCISFEISTSGNPRIYAANGNSATSTIFTGVSVLSEKIVRLSITVDAANKMAHCYVDGALKQSLAFDFDKIGNTIPTDRPLMVGGDYRSNNTTAFLGQIKSVYAYSDMRTSEEIANGLSLNDENLLVAYDFTSSGAKNLSKHEGYDLTMTDWKMNIVGENALTFMASNTYQVMKPFDKAILTYEAEVYFPKSNDTTTRGGTLLGNYYSNWGASCVNFEFKEKGAPRLYFEIGGEVYDFLFDTVDVRLDKFVFVTITLDPTTGEGKCYLDGELMQTVTKGEMSISDAVYKKEMYLGRDTRVTDGHPFKGAVKSLAVYSDVRTADEIKADMSALDKDSDNLLAMYEFSKDTGRSDISGNCYHICYSGETKPEDTTVPEAPEAATLDGLTFTGNDYAVVKKQFKNSFPYTFEATILLEEGYSQRAGVILGNHNSNSYKYLSFEIHENGVPRLCFTSPTDLNDVSTFDYKFSSVHVNTGTVTHLAITLDPATGTAICYVNGVAKQTITRGQTELTNDHFANYHMVLGNDPRSSGSSQYFKGVIGNVTLYSDTRSADEIISDFNGINLENDNLLLHYDLSNATSGNNIDDLTGNGYTVKYGEKASATVSQWIDPSDKPAVEDYLYSFAVVGDTQIIASSHGSSFGKIYDWILANQTDKKISYVFGLGDITNNDRSGEWDLARAHILEKLTGVIPYSVVRGNHDGTTNFNNVFATEEYTSQFDGFYQEGDVTNSYRFFEVSGTKYLLITLDYGANDSILNWAGEIIEANPDRKVVITTHAYLFRDGTTLDQGDVCPPATTGGSNNGDHMWDKLVSKYENIFLVMSGHDPYANVVVTQTEGVNGNIVTQILTDHQGVDTSTPTGMVTMLYFKADGSIEVETYSTIQEAYYKEVNQFVIEETEHKITEFTAISYANGYLKKGTVTGICDICGKEAKASVAPLMVFRGYAVKENDTAICVDYTINCKLLEVYKEMNGSDLTLGVVGCASDNLANKDMKPINSDGSSATTTAGSIINLPIETLRTNISIIVRSENWSLYGDRSMIICAYLIENGAVSYICNSTTASEAASAVTYNGIIKEGGIE